MKNIKLTNIEGIKCFNCKKMVFAVTTPFGGDSVTCPLCDSTSNSIYDEDFNDTDDDVPIYCKNCNSVFMFDKTHASNGCTDSVYYGKLVYEYEYGEKKYNGMPVFESFSQFKSMYPNLNMKFKIMTEVKPCEKASYPVNKYPQYYS
jgi:hypothetical protein